MPEETSAAPVAAAPNAAAQPKPDAQPANDPVVAGLLAGLGLAVEETPAPAPDPQTEPQSDGEPPEKPKFFGRTLGEIAREVRVTKEASSAPTDEQPKTETAPTPDAQPAAEPDPSTPDTPPAAAAPAAPKVEVERRPSIDQIVERTVKKTLEASRPTPPPEQPAAQAQPTVDPFEATLTENEREELNFARWAAQKYPQHKDYPNRVLGYLKKAASKIESILKENPDQDLEENEDFRKWKKQNAPDLPERKKLEKEHLKEEAALQAKAQIEQEIVELRRQTKLATVLPRIEKETAQHLQAVESGLRSDPNSLAAPILARASEVGWKAAIDEDQVFAPIVHNLQQASARYANELRLIAEGVKPFDAQNPDHQWIYGFVKGNSDFVAANDQARVRNGRTFLSRAEFNAAVAKDASAASRHWTFSDQELLDLLARNTQHNINELLKKENERLEKSGFVRQTKAAPATPGVPGVTQKETAPSNSAPIAATQTIPATAPAAKPHVSPRATPSAAPGAAKGATQPSMSPEAEEILSAMGVPLK